MAKCWWGWTWISRPVCRASDYAMDDAGPRPRILIVGVGNVLHGDDGFGVELAWRLAKQDFPPGVKVMETGIGGMSIVQELMDGYDAVLLLDAYQSGGRPGEVRLLQPLLPDLTGLDIHALRDYFADTHYATPIRALALLEHLGHLPRRIAVIGCEPTTVDRLELGLSVAVTLALDEAASLVHAWVAELQAGLSEKTRPAAT